MRTKKIPIQYIDKTTPIHAIHPIVKFIWLILISAMLMINRSYVLGIFLLIFILGLFYLGGFRVFQFRGAKIVFITSIFIALLQLFFNSNGQKLTSFFGVPITITGFEKAIYLSTRFCSIILIGFVFILTTNPNTLVYSFMRAGISYRFGFSFISALRLMSIFSGESEKIYFSSVIKGSSYALFPVRKFYKNITNYFRLLFVSIFEKVDVLVISMEGRGFGNKNKRTFLKPQPLKVSDHLLILFGLIVMGGNIYWRFNILVK